MIEKTMKLPGFNADYAISQTNSSFWNLSQSNSARNESVVLAGDTACQLACTAGYDIAVGLCVGLTGAAAPVCYAAAAVAYGACLKACG